MNSRFVASNDAPLEKKEQAWWFLFKNHKMLVMEESGQAHAPFVADIAEMGLHVLKERYLGTLDGHGCYYGELVQETAPGGAAFRGLRSLHERLEEGVFGVAMRAIHLIDWDRNEQYCGRCGVETLDKKGEIAKRCPQCGHITFPRISPAVIVLVEREGKVLLARGSRFTEEMYSVLAGFVEAGESLEETVNREIEEEVGISVKNIRYFGSQPWPFPDSLMIGFIAEYAGGEIRIDGTEIMDAGWFEPGKLPLIPDRISIARRLIDWFVEKHKGLGGG